MNYQTFHPTNKQLLEHYNNFKKGWSSPTNTYDIMFPLLNFSSTIEREYKISPHIQLGPLGPTEKTDIWNEQIAINVLRTMPLTSEEYSDIKFKLSGIHQQNKDYHGPPYLEWIIQEMSHILTAMRLLKEGYIGTPAIFFKGYIHSWTHYSSNHFVIPDYRCGKDYPIYEFSETDAKSLEVFTTTLQNFPNKTIDKPYGDLTVALRRFNQAYQRNLYEDQITDLCIALESCFVRSTKGSKSNLIASKGATLLIRYRNRQETEELLIEMYRSRNKVVHEGKLLSELKPKPEDFYYLCENVTRDILREYIFRISQGDTVNSINRNL